MSGVTVSYTVRFRKREGSAAVAAPRPVAADDAPLPAIPATATPRNTAPHVAADATPAAKLLALAHRVAHEIVVGNLRAYRDAAARLGISHARMSQLAALLLLTPTIQADILLGRRNATEGGLRRTAATADCAAQLRAAVRAARRQRAQAAARGAVTELEGAAADTRRPTRSTTGARPEWRRTESESISEISEPFQGAQAVVNDLASDTWRPTPSDGGQRSLRR